jgi:hypothetical protein
MQNKSALAIRLRDTGHVEQTISEITSVLLHWLSVTDQRRKPRHRALRWPQKARLEKYTTCTGGYAGIDKNRDCMSEVGWLSCWNKRVHEVRAFRAVMDLNWFNASESETNRNFHLSARKCGGLRHSDIR